MEWEVADGPSHRRGDIAATRGPARGANDVAPAKHRTSTTAPTVSAHRPSSCIHGSNACILRLRVIFTGGRTTTQTQYAQCSCEASSEGSVPSRRSILGSVVSEHPLKSGSHQPGVCSKAWNWNLQCFVMLYYAVVQIDDDCGA